MPAMVRATSKATAIAYKILGIPENLQNDESMERYRRLRNKHLKLQKPKDHIEQSQTYESLDMSY